MELKIDRILYRDPNSLFEKVSAITVNNTRIILSGKLNVDIGDIIFLSKYKDKFSRDGELFIDVISYEKIIEKEYVNVIRVLKELKWVGIKTADELVGRFGNNVFEKIDEWPLLKLNETKESFRELNKDVMKVMLVGFSKTYSEKIIKKYKNYGKAMHNPYALISISGITFEKVDDIAINYLKFDKLSKYRIESAGEYILKRQAGWGDNYLYLHKFYEILDELLQTKDERIKKIIELSSKFVVVNNMNDILDKYSYDGSKRYDSKLYCIYLKHIFEDEVYVSGRLADMLLEKKGSLVSNEDIKNIEYHYGMEYNESQKNVIKFCMRENLFIVSGLPGTGKTKTTQGICKLLEIKNKTFEVASPTGRGSEAFTYLTKFPCKTIHRLLGYAPSSREVFKFNENRLLRVDYLIIDEASMIDLNLFKHILKALPTTSKLILVGDPDQLPPVRNGNVLRQITKSFKVNYIKMEKIYRQSKESSIKKKAKTVFSGNMFKLDTEDDFEFIKITDNFHDDLKNKISEIDNHSIFDTQVITTRKMGKLGVNSLNIFIRDILNPLKEVKEKNYITENDIFRVDDKVMQIENNYNKNIFNGDIGKIRSIDGEKGINSMQGIIEVEYGDRILNYTFDEIDQIRLAYACTVHKFQGSQAKCIIFIFNEPIKYKNKKGKESNNSLCTRNMIYTGISRAQEKLIIFSNSHMIYGAIKNKHEYQRNSFLWLRMKQRYYESSRNKKHIDKYEYEKHDFRDKLLKYKNYLDFNLESDHSWKREYELDNSDGINTLLISENNIYRNYYAYPIMYRIVKKAQVVAKEKTGMGIQKITVEDNRLGKRYSIPYDIFCERALIAKPFRSATSMILETQYWDTEDLYR